MTWPTVIVKIATAAPSTAFTLDDATEGKLDTGTLGDTFGRIWSDVTADVLQESGISINRGSTRQAGPYFTTEAGRLTFELDNVSGDYDPLNLSSPYVSAGTTQLRPGLPVTVEATYLGAQFTLFSGYVDNWNVTYPGEANTVSTVSVAATDPIGVLVAADTPAVTPAVGAGETIAARLNRILDSAAWSAADRNIETTSTATMAATELDEPAWQELLNSATSVNGYLWLNNRGQVEFRTKSSFPRTTDLVVGDDGAMPVVSLELANDWDQVYNVVKLNRSEGSEQAVLDETSIAQFGQRAFSRTDLLVDTDDLVSESAGYILSQFRNQRLRLDAVNLEPDDTYSNDAWTALLGMEMLTRIGANITTTDGRSISTDGLVRGIRLQISSFNWNWQLSTVSAPDALGDFELDGAELGRLDFHQLAAF
jgi:hypothetical protein